MEKAEIERIEKRKNKLLSEYQKPKQFIYHNKMIYFEEYVHWLESQLERKDRIAEYNSTAFCRMRDNYYNS